MVFHTEPEPKGNRGNLISKKPEPLAELNKTVTPVTSAVQWTLKNLDSGLRRNDVEGLLQEAHLRIF
jgi:hypothetical protein